METETASPLEGLIQTLDHPETHILPLLHSKESAEATRKELLQTCQFLFQEIEGLAKTYQSLKKKDAQDTTPPGLSGLSELYVSEGAVDAETIWGQVDLQNDALKKLLKKSVKNLGKSTDDICVLDMGEVFSEDEEEQNSNDDDDDDDDQEEKSGSDEEESDGEDDDVDEETKRIRERMERALDDMGSDQEEEEQDSDEESSESDEKAKAVQPKKSEQEDLVDPAAEELNDGFFDINEMENFADEEEEYLPDEAFGQPKKEKKTLEKKSFHQRQRDGDLDSGSDEDGSDDEDFEEQQVVRRKKYREDDEIDALHDLYKEPESEEEEEEDEEGDIVNMTAADLFGKPNKKYYEQYKTKPKSKPSKPEKGDDDSWGEYDFDKEDQSAWRDDNSDEEADEEDDEDKEEDASDDEEEEAMNDEEVGSSKKKNEDNSKHARQDEKLRRQTEQLEKEMLAEKPWQMTGEAKGTSRPVNSLLEGTPEFQVASKQAPTITIEHTTNLEDIIKQRVIAEDWDDLVPRELPDVGWHKNRGELPEVSQEKSKLGLGELYEREYLKKAVGYDVDAAEKQTEEDKARNEMKQLFANLCSKLDALSNYHFAPRPIADEAEVRPITTPAIAMEEVLPLHVSDARGVAPEEVYGAKRGRDGILRGETEMDQTERKRMRMSKKSARRKVRKDKLADEKLISRLEPGLGLNNPYEKRKIREELTEARAHGRVTTGEKEAAQTKYGSSGTFFKRLQTEAQESIRDNTAFGEKKEEKSTKPKSSSYKL
jgi:U3 small nucleolar RNA-associated protein MPP10